MSDKTAIALRSSDGQLSSPLHELLGPAPLIKGEDANVYWALHERIRSAVSPKDAIEEIWVKDISDLVWEIERLRRFKAQLLRTLEYEGVDELLSFAVSTALRVALLTGWKSNDQLAKDTALRHLKSAGFDQDAINAQAMAANADVFDKFDRQLARIEARRDAVLREVDRHRAAVAQALRQASAEIADGEFNEIAAESVRP